MLRNPDIWAILFSLKKALTFFSKKKKKTTILRDDSSSFPKSETSISKLILPNFHLSEPFAEISFLNDSSNEICFNSIPYFSILSFLDERKKRNDK